MILLNEYQGQTAPLFSGHVACSRHGMWISEWHQYPQQILRDHFISKKIQKKGMCIERNTEFPSKYSYNWLASSLTTNPNSSNLSRRVLKIFRYVSNIILISIILYASIFFLKVTNHIALFCKPVTLTKKVLKFSLKEIHV